ncbi:PAS domain-containing protein [Streptomyces sp. bgisy100]|uniref:PAS domain-containing protein n=1 Tax=Streptomyces sp. bgisy100 TaxID=3413783 RepID=UPI003D73E03D
MDETGLSSLLAHMPVSWWETDASMRLVSSGGGAFDDAGVTQQFLDTVREECRRAVRSTDGFAHFQAQFRGRIFEVTAGPERRDGGETGIRGLAVDISAHVADRRRYDAFAAFAPAAAFIRDRQGRYLWVNHAYAHLYDTTPDAIVGRSVTDVDSPEDAALFLALDREVLSAGKPVRHSLTYHHPDGTPGQAVGHRFPVKEASGACVAGIYADITDYTRALRGRLAAEADLQALRDQSGLPCALLSAGGRIRQVSAAAADLLHVSAHDLIGKPAHQFLAPGVDLTSLHGRWDDLIARRRRRLRTRADFVDARGYQWRATLHLVPVGRSLSRARTVWAVLTSQSLPHQPLPAITPAQIRILSLLAAGRSNAEIATSLHLSRQTVDYHLSRLRRLLGAPTRPALVGRAYVLGILDPQAWPPRSATAHHRLSTA